MVGVTQPRRIAAVSVSEFIARQIEHDHPDTIVGYTMRFEDKTDDETVIKVMTDGILLQELKGDRLLSRYSVLMVDEAHERSLNIDFILGHAEGHHGGPSRVPASSFPRRRSTWRSSRSTSTAAPS